MSNFLSSLCSKQSEQFYAKLKISWAAVFDVLSLFFRIESSSTWWRRHSLDQLTLVTITCFLFTFLTLKQYIIAQFNPQNRSTEWKTGPESLNFLISSGCFTGKSSRYSIYVAFKVKKKWNFYNRMCLLSSTYERYEQ